MGVLHEKVVSSVLILSVLVSSYMIILIQDVWLSKALLYGVEFTLLGLTMAAFWNDLQARIFPTILKQQVIGGDPVTTAVKFVVNAFLNTVATASYMLAASIIFKNPLMWPFAIITFGLARFYGV
jgi:hypothetical protein